MIPVQATKTIYLGNGTTTQWPFTFKYNDVATVKVALYDIPTDKQTILTKDYYVDTVKNVVLYPGYVPGQEPPSNEQPEILPKTQKIIIYRETPESQEEDLGDRYPLTTIEKMVDKNTMLIQEMSEKVDRSVKAPIGQDTEVDTDELEQTLAETLTAKDKADASATAAADSAVSAATSATQSANSADQSGKYAAQAEAVVTAAANAYDNTMTYSYPTVVAYTDGYAYRCIGENVIGEQPDTSTNWVRIDGLTEDFWEPDADGGIMPTLNPSYSPQFQLDTNGDIMPRLII